MAGSQFKTHQLPLLLKNNQQVLDLSRSLDQGFRAAYHGGIVDVYTPHLQGGGYYYDVNSLYPTAMLQAMPVGTPNLVPFTVQEFLEGD